MWKRINYTRFFHVIIKIIVLNGDKEWRTQKRSRGTYTVQKISRLQGIPRNLNRLTHVHNIRACSHVERIKVNPRRAGRSFKIDRNLYRNQSAVCYWNSRQKQVVKRAAWGIVQAMFFFREQLVIPSPYSR